MLADLVGGDPSLDPARHSPARDEPPAPDPGVVDSARHRLSAQLATAAWQYAGQLPGYLIDDLYAVNAVIDAARDGAEPSADALDVGAGLVVLGNLRLYLDQLETDLLNGAQRVGLVWDVIAAILGIPASAAQERHEVLRARPDPQ
jgi:hypothetical protein